MKFESMRAWEEGLALVKANSAVALPLAGVFFVVPALVLNLLTPNPEINQALSPEQQMAAFLASMQAVLPYMLLTVVVEQAGMLALLTLFTDRTRPTVGQAIGQGFMGLPSYLGAMVLLMLGGGLAGGLLITLAAISRVVALVALVIAALLAALIYFGIRTSLAAPVIAIEHRRNPLHVLARSWDLTRGNAARLFFFFLLIALAYGLITAATVGVASVTLTMAAGRHVGEVAAGVIQAFLGGVYITLQAGIFAAIHRQLAGPSDEALRSTFD